MTTPRLGLPELSEGQSGKYLTHNEALALLETFCAGVLSRSNGTVPSSPAEGAAYIMDVDTGAWADGTINDIAVYYSGSWKFVTPVNGTIISCVGEQNILMFDGTNWQDYQTKIAKKWALILG